MLTEEKRVPESQLLCPETRELGTGWEAATGQSFLRDPVRAVCPLSYPPCSLRWEGRTGPQETVPLKQKMKSGRGWLGCSRDTAHSSLTFPKGSRTHE